MGSEITAQSAETTDVSSAKVIMYHRNSHICAEERSDFRRNVRAYARSCPQAIWGEPQRTA